MYRSPGSPSSPAAARSPAGTALGKHKHTTTTTTTTRERSGLRPVGETHMFKYYIKHT